MINFDSIIEYEQCFDEREFIEAESILSKPQWGFRNISRTDQSHKVFWGMELNNEELFTNTLFNRVKSVVGSNFKLDRVYANGQTYGLNSAPHHDDFEDNSYTFLIYMNREWDLLWNGSTVFLNRYFDNKTKTEMFFDGDHSNRIKKVMPSPNKALLFPGQIVHFAESPSRDYFGLRVTLVYKLFKI